MARCVINAAHDVWREQTHRADAVNDPADTSVARDELKLRPDVSQFVLTVGSRLTDFPTASQSLFENR